MDLLRMMVYLFQNPQLVIPYSCCKLKDGVTFTEVSPTENDVEDWKACQAGYPEGKDGQLNTDVSVFLTYISVTQPTSAIVIASKGCLEYERFVHNLNISLLHFTKNCTHRLIKHDYDRSYISCNVF